MTEEEKVVNTTMSPGWALLGFMFLSCWVGMIAGLTQYVLMAVFG